MGHLTTGIISRVWFIAETIYGGGDSNVAGADVKYAMKHPDAAGNLASVNVLSANGSYKAKKYKRNRWTAPGLVLGRGVLHTQTLEFPEIEFTYALQGTGADPFFTTAKGGTKGTLGTSYMFQIAVPDETEVGTTKYFNIFGAQLLSYSVDGAFDTTVPPLVTVKFKCFNMAVNTGTVQTTAWPTGTIKKWDEFTVTLDADPITQLKAFTMTLTIELNETSVNGSSSFTKIDTNINDLTLEFKVDFYTDAADLLQDTITEAINLIVAAWTDGDGNTLSVSDCYVDEDNYLELDNTDINTMEYSITVKSGDSVFT